MLGRAKRARCDPGGRFGALQWEAPVSPVRKPPQQPEFPARATPAYGKAGCRPS